MDFRCPTRRQFCVATGTSLISWPAVLQATQPGVDLYGPKQREAVRRGLVALASEFSRMDHLDKRLINRI